MYYTATEKTNRDNMDQSKSFWFLVRITNTTISDKHLCSPPFQTNLQECFKRVLSFETGYQLWEGVNLDRTANIINILNKEEELSEIKLKDTRACRKCGHDGLFQRDYLYNNDDENDTSALVIGQILHALSANSPLMKTVLKLILKELINMNGAKKMAGKQQPKGNIGFTNPSANTTMTVAIPKVVTLATSKGTVGKLKQSILHQLCNLLV